MIDQVVDFHKAECWLPIGIQDLLRFDRYRHDLETRELLVKAIGEYLLVSRAIGRVRGSPLFGHNDIVALFRRLCGRDGYLQPQERWQITVILGESPFDLHPVASDAWEYRYFSCLATGGEIDKDFWRRASATTLVHVLKNPDSDLRTCLYNFTHSVFFGTDFGSMELPTTHDDDISKLLVSISIALRMQAEWDLLYELESARMMLRITPDEEVIRYRLGRLPGYQSLDGWLLSEGCPKSQENRNSKFKYSVFHTTLAALLSFAMSKKFPIFGQTNNGSSPPN